MAGLFIFPRLEYEKLAAITLAKLHIPIVVQMQFVKDIGYEVKKQDYVVDEMSKSGNTFRARMISSFA